MDRPRGATAQEGIIGRRRLSDLRENRRHKPNSGFRLFNRCDCEKRANRGGLEGVESRTSFARTAIFDTDCEDSPVNNKSPILFKGLRLTMSNDSPRDRTSSRAVAENSRLCRRMVRQIHHQGVPHVRLRTHFGGKVMKSFMSLAVALIVCTAGTADAGLGFLFGKHHKSDCCGQVDDCCGHVEKSCAAPVAKSCCAPVAKTCCAPAATTCAPVAKSCCAPVAKSCVAPEATCAPVAKSCCAPVAKTCCAPEAKSCAAPVAKSCCAPAASVCAPTCAAPEAKSCAAPVATCEVATCCEQTTCKKSCGLFSCFKKKNDCCGEKKHHSLFSCFKHKKNNDCCGSTCDSCGCAH